MEDGTAGKVDEVAAGVVVDGKEEGGVGGGSDDVDIGGGLGGEG